MDECDEYVSYHMCITFSYYILPYNKLHIFLLLPFPNKVKKSICHKVTRISKKKKKYIIILRFLFSDAY